MNFFNNIKKRIAEYAEQQKESREFRAAAEEKLKPIRRAAWLQQKMSQAVEEGKAIAEKEFKKSQTKQQNKKIEDFHLPDVNKNQWEPTVFKDKKNKLNKGGKK